jgi:hypothetical protein
MYVYPNDLAVFLIMIFCSVLKFSRDLIVTLTIIIYQIVLADD